MFECKYPLLEVIQAIEKIRESKGPTEMEVLDYVRKHVRKPDDPVKVLKTITTLKKLVEEGVLVQKGKRYMFSSNPPPESSGGEECDEEENDGGPEKEESNMDCEDEGDEDEDEDENCDEDDDDDDDDDDDEEESDDGSSDDCKEKDADLVGQGSKEPAEGGEGNNMKTVLKNRYFKRPSGSAENLTKKVSSSNADVSKCSKSAQEKKTGGGKAMIKGNNNKANNVIDQTSGDGKNKGGEAIAFCTRDFIDSQYRPQSHSSCQIQPSKSEEMPQDSLSPRSEKMALGNMLSRSKRTSRMKRGQMSESDYRSRSPIRGMKAEMFESMRLDHADEIGSISSQLFQEQGDAEMDVDGRKDGEGAAADYDMFRHRSPIGPPPPNTPGVHVSREESCCSNFELKNQAEIKVEPNFEEYSLKKNIQGEVSQLKCKENVHKRGGEGEKRPENGHKRGMSSDDDKNMAEGARASLCSICEKKKRNS